MRVSRCGGVHWKHRDILILWQFGRKMIVFQEANLNTNHVSVWEAQKHFKHNTRGSRRRECERSLQVQKWICVKINCCFTCRHGRSYCHQNHRGECVKTLVNTIKPEPWSVPCYGYHMRPNTWQSDWAHMLPQTITLTSVFDETQHRNTSHKLKCWS